MEFKLNNGFSIFISLVVLSFLFLGIPIVSTIINVIELDGYKNFDLVELVIPSLEFTLSNLSRLVFGAGLYFYSKKLNQDKWTWLLIGLVYGQLALILFGLIIIAKNLNLGSQLIKPISIILIILVLTHFLNWAVPLLIKPLMTMKFNASDYNVIKDYHVFLTFILYGIMVLINSIFAYRTHKFASLNGITNKFAWSISTLFLGLFPVILINEFLIIKNKV